MSYLVGAAETNSMGGLGWGLPTSLPTPWSVAVNTAAALTPAGLMWAAPPDVQAAAAAQTSPIQKAEIIRVGHVQSLLMQLGLYPGPVSGKIDGNTQQALDKFRQAVGLPTGVPISAQDEGALQQAVTQLAAQQGIQLPGITDSGSQGGMLSGLPSWALPAGLALGAGLLVMLLRK